MQSCSQEVNSDNFCATAKNSMPPNIFDFLQVIMPQLAPLSIRFRWLIICSLNKFLKKGKKHENLSFIQELPHPANNFVYVHCLTNYNFYGVFGMKQSSINTVFKITHVTYSDALVFLLAGHSRVQDFHRANHDHSCFEY